MQMLSMEPKVILHHCHLHIFHPVHDAPWPNDQCMIYVQATTTDMHSFKVAVKTFKHIQGGVWHAEYPLHNLPGKKNYLVLMPLHAEETANTDMHHAPEHNVTKGQNGADSDAQ